MKKLITIAVVFALAMGGVFAADLGVSVIGTVDLIGGSSVEDSDVVGGGNYNALAISGSGENDDGTFGAWYRFKFDQDGSLYWPELRSGDGGGYPLWSGLAWWRPVEQFKLTIGGNQDGIYAKEGYAVWMYNQTANDTGVVSADHGWGWNDYQVGGGNGYIFRHAFWGGFDRAGLLMDIKPTEMIGINLVLPYFDHGSDPSVARVFLNTKLQLDLNLDFGNIALSFDMEDYKDGADSDGKDIYKFGGRLFAFFDLSSVENLNLAIGVGFGLPQTYEKEGKYTSMDHVAAGFGLKYQVNDAFGIKSRLLAEFAGNSKPDGGDADPYAFGLIFDIQPYFAVNDGFKVFADIGIMLVGEDQDAKGNKQADSAFGFHFGPYVQIGNEWGPSFFGGIRIWTNGEEVDDKTVVNWTVPIAVRVAF